MSQHEELAKFLKECRSRLSPADFGLPPAGRRRGVGLRREEVAALAGMSVTWYTWFEQGRDVRVSVRLLESLSRVMKLNDEERAYLFALAQNREPPLSPEMRLDVTPAVQHTLDTMSIPALVMTPLWQVVAWNWMVARVFRDYGEIEPERRNLLRILVTNPDYRSHSGQYEEMVQRLVARFRMDYSRAANNPDFDRLLEELLEVSPDFAKYWARPEIVGHMEGIHTVHNPRFGGITFQHTSYSVEDRPSLRLVLFSPFDAPSARRVARLAAEDPRWTDTDEASAA